MNNINIISVSLLDQNILQWWDIWDCYLGVFCVRCDFRYAMFVMWIESGKRILQTSSLTMLKRIVFDYGIRIVAQSSAFSSVVTSAHGFNNYARSLGVERCHRSY